MAYQKHTWTDGEIITKELLNNIENGIATVETTPGPKGDTGAQGPAGKDAKEIEKLELNVSAEGEITAGTITFKDKSTLAVTVTKAGA